MKKIVFSVLTFVVFNATAQITPIIDNKRILNELDQIIGTQTFEEAQVNCVGKVQMKGQTKGKFFTKIVKIKDCTPTEVSFIGRKKGILGLFKSNKDKFTKDQYDAVNGNMVRYILQQFGFKTNVNGSPTQNRLVINNYEQMNYELADGSSIPAIKLNASLIQDIFIGIEDSTPLSVVVTRDPELPLVERVLSISFANQNLLEIVKIY